MDFDDASEWDDELQDRLAAENRPVTMSELMDYLDDLKADGMIDGVREVPVEELLRQVRESRS